MPEPLTPDSPAPQVPSASPGGRSLLSRRVRARQRFLEKRLRTLRPQLAFAGLLAFVGVVVTAPVLLDDLVLRSGYLWRSTADAVEITHAVMLREQPRIALTKGTLSIPASLSSRPKAGEALAALLKGGTIRLDLVNPSFDIDLSTAAGEEAGASGFSPVSAISPMLAAISDATFERLSIKDGTVRLIITPQTELLLQDFNAEIIIKRRTAMRFKGQFKFRGEPVTFDTTLGSRAERRGSQRTPIRARIASDALVAVLDGRLDWRAGPVLAASSAEITIPNVRTLVRWLGPVWPSGPGLKDFSAAGDLAWSEGVLTMRRGLFLMDGNTANGSLQLNLNGARPALSGTLAADDLNLDVYFPAQPAAGPGGLPDLDAEAANSLLGRFRTADNLSLPLLGFVEADVRLSAERVSFAGIEGQHAAAGINLHNGRLLFDLASLSLPNRGSAHGALVVDGWVSPQPYSLHGEADQIDLGAATRAVIGRPLGTGIGSIIADLKASGASGLDVLSRLDGTVILNLPDGGQAACSAASIVAAARADPPGSGDPCATPTPLAPLAAFARLTNGVLTLDPVDSLEVQPPVSLSGSIDLVTKVIDLRITELAVPDNDAKPASPSPSLPIVVRGRPEALKFSVP